MPECTVNLQEKATIDNTSQIYMSKECAFWFFFFVLFLWSKSCGSWSKEQIQGNIKVESHKLRPHVERETFQGWGSKAMLLHKNIYKMPTSLHSQSKLRKVNQKDRPSLLPGRSVILWKTSLCGASGKVGAEETQVQMQN